MIFLERILKWIIVGGALLLCFSAFFVSPETAFPAVFLRVIVTRILIEIMMVAYIALALFFPEYRPRRSMVAYAVGAFLFAFLLSTIFGINAYRAFWGSHERMEGYVTLLHFGMLFMVLFGTFRKPEEFKKLLWLSVVVSVAQCFYAFGQTPYLNIQSTKLYANETGRISGTFGNATILALYLDFMVFFTFMLMLWERKRWAYTYGGIALAIQLIAVFFSGTRGSMLGIAAGFMLVAAGYMFFGGKRSLRITGISVLTGIVLFFGLVHAFKDTEIVRNTYMLQRASIFSSGLSTFVSRSTAWKIGLSGWKDRFWLGYGMDNFNYVFNHYYDPWMLYHDSGDFDRPHNRFVDSIVTGGFLGITTHLAVFGAAAWFLLRKWWRNKTFFFPLAVTGLLAAYALHIFTLFDHMISYQNFALVLALVAVWEARTIADRQPDDDDKALKAVAPESSDDGDVLRYAPLKIAGVVCLAAGMSWYGWIANVVPAEASYWAQVASNTNYASGGKQFREAFAALKKSFDLNTYLNVDMRLALSGFAQSWARSAQNEEDKAFAREVLEYLAGQFEKNLTEHHPDIKDFLTHQQYAQIAMQLAAYDPSWQNKALEALRTGVEEYPKKYQLIQSLAQLYMQQGQAAESLAVYENHPLEMARGSYYFNVAAAYYNVGRNEDAWPFVEKAMAGSFDLNRNLERLVDICVREGKLDRVIKLYEYQLVGGQAGDTQLMASLAETYRQAGDIANARRVGEMLLKADPEHAAETELFLQDLEATN